MVYQIYISFNGKLSLERVTSDINSRDILVKSLIKNGTDVVVVNVLNNQYHSQIFYKGEKENV